MKDEKNSNLAAFLKGWSAWSSAAPKVLIEEDPIHVIHVLQLCDAEQGISQSVLIRELRMPQSGLSKLMKKLEELRWIEVRAAALDRRVKLATTAQAGRNWLRRFEALVSGVAGGGRSRRRTVTPQSDSRQSFDFDGCFRDDAQPEIG